MKKSIILIVGTILFFCHSKAQSKSENDSMYLFALKMYNAQIDSFYARYSANKEAYSAIYIDKTDLMDSFPKEVNGRKVVVLTRGNRRKIYKANHNRLTEVIMFPMQIRGNQIAIQFTPYGGELKKRNKYRMGLSDWTIVYFKFDCVKVKWIYDRIENHGI